MKQVANYFTLAGLLLIAGLTIGLGSCKKDKKNDEPGPDAFDKQALLQNVASKVIVPGYNNFNAALDSVILSYSGFKNAPSVSGLHTIRKQLHTAYLLYQRISVYEFGPAEQELLRMSFNVFPTDTPQISSNIASGNYNLASNVNNDTRGLPALDFLFYGVNLSDAQLIQSFSTGKKQYVSDVLNALKAKTGTVLAAWQNSYATQFTSSLGTDIGSSLGFLVNQINFELDHLKNAKFGIPLGKKTLGTPLPKSCEAYYSQQSLTYALADLEAIEMAYLGKSPGGEDGTGLDDYLEHLQTGYNGGSLNAAIKNQFAAARAAIMAISGPLSSAVVTNPAPVSTAYNELAKLLVLLKTDMPSALGVIITYQDGDGD